MYSIYLKRNVLYIEFLWWYYVLHMYVLRIIMYIIMSLLITILRLVVSLLLHVLGIFLWASSKKIPGFTHPLVSTSSAPCGKVKLSILLEIKCGLSDYQYTYIFFNDHYLSFPVLYVFFECCILSLLPPTWWSRKSRDATHAQLPWSQRWRCSTWKWICKGKMDLLHNEVGWILYGDYLTRDGSKISKWSKSLLYLRC